MALTTPILLTFLAFDATQSFTFKFDSIGGDQVIGSNLIVQKVSDNTEVYNITIDSFLFQHTVNANVFQNGQQLKAKIRTKNASGQFSNFSDWIPFKPLSLPVISITNLNGGLINNQVYEFQGTYSQAEGSLLKSYRFLLYDENENLLQSFNEKMDGLLTQQITGIQNQVQYKIQLKVITQDNIEVSTPKYLIMGDYVQPTLNSIIELTNTNDGGVKIAVNCIQIIGRGEYFTYENNDWVNVTDGFVVFDNLNPFPQDFSTKLWLSNVTEDMDFLYLEGMYYTNSIGIIYYDDKFHAFVENSFSSDKFIRSHYISNTVSVSLSDVVVLEIKVINNRIDLYAEVIS